jgi:mannose-6-phosphate isomerase-like protein (cupin superfamily)
VLGGSVTVIGDDAVSVVEQGCAFLIGSGEHHTVRNCSEAPALVFSAYWMAQEEATGAAGTEVRIHA